MELLLLKDLHVENSLHEPYPSSVQLRQNISVQLRQNMNIYLIKTFINIAITPREQNNITSKWTCDN